MATKKRDPAIVARFLKKEGLTKVPKGKEVDHKKPVRPEYSCSSRKIVMMESVNDWNFDNLTRFP